MIAQKCSLPIATGDDLPYPGGVSTFTFMDVEHGTVTRKDAVSQSREPIISYAVKLKLSSFPHGYSRPALPGHFSAEDGFINRRYHSRLTS